MKTIPLLVGFSVPLVPPSVNDYKRPRKGGGMYVIPEAKAYKDAVAMFAKGAKAPWEHLRVSVTVTSVNASRQDLDNYGKLICDSLQHAGVITNDNDIWELLLYKRQSLTRDGENTQFYISEI